MTVLLDDLYHRRDAATAPAIRVAIVLSALVHAVILSELLPQVRFPSPDELKPRGISPPLEVNLVRPRVIPPDFLCCALNSVSQDLPEPFAVDHHFRQFQDLLTFSPTEF